MAGRSTAAPTHHAASRGRVVHGDDGLLNVLLEVLVRLDRLLGEVDGRVDALLDDLGAQRLGLGHGTGLFAGAHEGLEVVGVAQVVELDL